MSLTKGFEMVDWFTRIPATPSVTDSFSRGAVPKGVGGGYRPPSSTGTPPKTIGTKHELGGPNNYGADSGWLRELTEKSGPKRR